MASSNSIIAGKLRGSIGKELVFRKCGDKTVVAKAPGKRGPGGFTVAQGKAKERFLQATRYGKQVLANPELSESYRHVLAPRQTVYSRAVADFLNAPRVESVHADRYTGHTGDKIQIRAVDDFRVASVTATLCNEDGSVAESGEAIASLNGIDYVYTLTEDHSGSMLLRIMVTDIPGNMATVEQRVG